MNRAISEKEKNLLLKNANIKETMLLTELMPEILVRNRSPEFTRKATIVPYSDEYIWAHNTAPGIIWLWLRQDSNTQQQWLREPKSSWVEFEFKEPSHDSPIGWGSSTSASASASTSASAAYPQPGPLSFEAVSVPSSPRRSSSSSPRRSSCRSPRRSSSRSPRKHKGGGGSYRKRRITAHKKRKTHHKYSHRISRSRSRHIRRKKTHHRRHPR